MNNSKPANFIGPRLPYVRRKQNPVKPARRAKRVQPHISAGEIEKRRAIR